MPTKDLTNNQKKAINLVDKVHNNAIHVLTEMFEIVEDNPNDGTLGKKIRDYVRNIGNNE